MSLAKKMLIWLAVVNLLTFLVESPSWRGWALINVLTFAIVFWQDNRQFSRDFILFFDDWYLSKGEAAAVVTKFARRVGQTCIQQERVQRELAIVEMVGRYDHEIKLRRDIKELGDAIEGFKEEWVTVKKLFMRRFPSEGEPLHWTDIEPYYTQGKRR